MNSLTISSLRFSLVFLTYSCNVFAAPCKLSTCRQTYKENKLATERFKIQYYTQILDHFNYGPQSYTTFPQRYAINSKYWGGAKANAPIFAFLGEESPLENNLNNIGFLTENAPGFKALIIFIEHRYYGKSIPFGSSMRETLKNKTTRAYLSSAQAIEDYAEVLIYIRKQLSAQNCPVIVFGGSYGGMLASWFRLKYPHIALGALASSAPILYFDDITPQNGYYSVVTKDFREASENCYTTVRNSWSEIDKISSKPNGLSILSKKFKTCRLLNSSFEMKDYLDSIYTEVAQYNEPPTYPVTILCGGIDGAPEGTDILGQILSGVVAYKGRQSCYDTNEYNYQSDQSSAWGWQTCTEIVFPIGWGGNDTMFPSSPFNLSNYIKRCKGLYDISPRPHWITTYYGGHDIRLVLHRFASNIIFSNGLRDPYSSGGVLEDISDSIISINTVNGSHCLDILLPTEKDPKWLVMQREKEAEIIRGWLTNYYADLRNFKG